MDTKQMAFSGSWYPETSSQCLSFIKEVLSESDRCSQSDFRGGIVPHAGWYFSGAISCRVMAAIAAAGPVDTIVLFGGHMHPDSKPFLLSHGFVETPFGTIQVDHDFSDLLCEQEDVDAMAPGVFPDENTFELQNPFIRYFFPEAKIVMCAVPPSRLSENIGTSVVRAAKRLGRKIRIIGSTDMTHYGPDFGLLTAGVGEKALRWVTKENDRSAVKAMLEMDVKKIIATGLSNRSMCCPGAAAAAVAACRAAGMEKAVELAYATSFEKSRSDSFVGYSGVLYH